MEMDQDWPTARRRLLELGEQLGERLRELRRSDDVRAETALARERTAVLGEYRELLPEIMVARCPLTDTVVRFPFDAVDLDGWFWEYDNPIRRVPTLPPTWFAMTGALRVGGAVPHTRTRRRPGPEVPYVVPRLLAAPDTYAVIAQVPVGPHIGWAISYFGASRPAVELEDTWGADRYPVYDNGAWVGWNSNETPLSELDFELEPWIDAGRLRWIAPGDDAAVLRADADVCPYTGLDGSRLRTTVVRGEVLR